MQVARPESFAKRCARLPGSRPNPQARPPIAAIPSGQANIQIKELIIAGIPFSQIYDVAVVATTGA
jgi:hypothetical protein